ncbi:hypothetical protein [Bradyrhizobium japonicum]|nr:hypothetical protein [Bradyrhizobium japonicum]
MEQIEQFVKEGAVVELGVEEITPVAGFFRPGSRKWLYKLGIANSTV